MQNTAPGGWSGVGRVDLDRHRAPGGHCAYSCSTALLASASTASPGSPPRPPYTHLLTAQHFAIVPPTSQRVRDLL